jgi:hypothetical protein
LPSTCKVMVSIPCTTKQTKPWNNQVCTYI